MAEAAGTPSSDTTRAHAEARADDVTDDDLASRPLEVILEELVTKYGPKPLVLRLEDRYSTQEGDEVHLVYRFQGPGDLLLNTSRVFNQMSYSGDRGEAPFSFTLQDDDITPEELEAAMSHLVSKVDQQVLSDVRAVNDIIEQRQLSFTEAAKARLERRWRRTRMLRGALQKLEVPLGPSPTARIEIPVRPAPLSMAVIEQAAAAGAPEWTLAGDLAEGVVQTISAFAQALERLPGTADRLLGQDEEALRDVLLFVLNANYQGQVTGETFVGQGKTDLLLRWKDRDAFVGECKIWKGAKALGDGVEQLLSLYTLWRQSRVALVLFIRDPKDATSIIRKAHEAIVAHPRYVSTIQVSEPDRRGDYRVMASGDEQRHAQLTLLPVVLTPAPTESGA